MSVVRVKWSDLPRALDKEHRKFLAACERGLLEGALASLPALRAATKVAPAASPRGRRGAVDRGGFMRGWKARKVHFGVKIYNDSSYAGVVEFGRRPGGKMPPQKVIARWAKRRAGLTAKEAKSAAFLMARAIARRGLRGRGILKATRPAVVRNAREAIVRALRRSFP